MSNKHTLDFTDDPQTDRRDMVDAMKGFKNSSFPKNPFKNAKPQTATDPAYTPFKGKEPR
jgi:hypothetical protein